jgi:hypothetical protein
MAKKSSPSIPTGCFDSNLIVLAITQDKIIARLPDLSCRPPIPKKTEIGAAIVPHSSSIKPFRPDFVKRKIREFEIIYDEGSMSEA